MKELFLLLSTFMLSNSGVVGEYQPIVMEKCVVVEENTTNCIDTEKYTFVLPDNMTYEMNEQQEPQLYIGNNWVGEIKCYTVDDTIELEKKLEEREYPAAINTVTDIFLVDILGFQEGDVEYITNFGGGEGDCDFEAWVGHSEAPEKGRIHYFFVQQNDVCDISILEYSVKDIDIYDMFAHFEMK